MMDRTVHPGSPLAARSSPSGGVGTPLFDDGPAAPAATMDRAGPPGAAAPPALPGGSPPAPPLLGECPAAEWSGAEAEAWLRAEGLGRYAEALGLVGALASGPALLALSQDDLEAEELGIDPGHAAALGALLVGLRGGLAPGAIAALADDESGHF